MTRAERKAKVLMELRVLERESDFEDAHVRADRLLLELINDPEVSAAFEAVGKWYA